jgi:hypothetical protein
MVHLRTGTMKSPHLLRQTVAMAFLGSLLSSCASVSVKRDGVSKNQAPTQKPTRIYVEPFSVEHTKAKESFARKPKNTLKFEVQKLLTKNLVEDLTQTIAPARILKPGEKPPANAWVVTGELTRAAEGSRFLRMGLGLGLGGTKLETRTMVRQGGKPPFLEFETTGGSNAMPGGATNPIPFSGIPTALLHAKEGVTDDSERTSRQITARIAQYMVGRGWLDPAKAPPLKVATE